MLQHKCFVTDVSVGFFLTPFWSPWQPMRDLEETKDPKQGNGSQHSRSNPCPHALCGPSQVQWQPVCQSRDLESRSPRSLPRLTCPLPLHPIIICQHRLTSLPKFAVFVRLTLEDYSQSNLEPEITLWHTNFCSYTKPISRLAMCSCDCLFSKYPENFDKVYEILKIL